jgi:hypothetical protein
MLRRNKAEITCETCGVKVPPGKGWAYCPSPGQWHALCEEHKPRDILSELRAVDGIVDLKGRQYVKYNGLLALAKKEGRVDIIVEKDSIDMAKKSAVMKATVTGPRGQSVDYGDATPSNCSKMVAEAFVRMASTRAKARALRDYLGCGLTAIEELPGDAPKE